MTPPPISALVSTPPARSTLVGREEVVDRTFTRLVEGGSVLLLGRPGIGRSSVLAELRRLYAGPILQLAATAETATLPLGVLTRALPELGDLSERTLGQARRVVAARLRDLAGGQQLLVTVDDAHLLDPVTAVGLREAIAGLPSCAVALSATCSLEAGAAAGSAWEPWVTAGCDPVHLGGLDPDAIDLLAAIELGGPLEAPLAAELRTRSGGSPLAIIELLRGAMETRALHFDGEVWRADTALPLHRLSDLLGPRLAELDHDERADAELVALTGALPDLLVATLSSAERIDRLTSVGILRWSWVEGRRHLQVNDPLDAELIVAGMEPHRRTRALARVLDALERTGGGAFDPVRVAEWRLEVGGGGPELFDRAARAAFGDGDYALAGRLARGAVARGGGSSSALAAGAAAVEVGRTDEGIRLLTAAAAAADGEAEHAAATVALAHARWARAGRWEEAASLLSELLDRLGAGPLRAEAEAYVTVVAAAAGRIDEVREGLRAGLALAEGEVRLPDRTGLLLGAAAALVADDLSGAEVDAALALGDAAGHDAAPALPLGPQLIQAIGALRSASPDARPGSDELGRALERGTGDEAAWWALVVGRDALRRGLVEVAQRHLAEAVRGFEAVDSMRLRPLALVHLARARAAAGACLGARTLLAELEEERRHSPRIDAWAKVTEASLEALERGAGAGIDAALDAGERAEEAGLAGVAASAWELALTLGEGERVRDAFARLAARRPTPETSALALGAEALAEGCGRRMETAARQLAVEGRRLLAAELAGHAAAWGAGARAQALCQGLVTSCSGAVLVGTGPVISVELSPRVRAIARGAVSGVSTATLADEHSLSRRTVDNHLGRAYRLLGVSGRRELALVYPEDAPPLADR